MKNRRNYYRILQVQPDAPQAVIKASYHTLLRELKLHPDLGGDHWNATILNNAYEVLGDPAKRAEYDKKLFLHYTKNPLPASNSNRPPVISHFCPFCKRPLARKPSSDVNCPSCKSPVRSAAGQKPEMTRRSITRIRKKGRITFYCDWPQKGIAGELVDISPKGMRFKTNRRMRSGQQVKISTDELRAVATVRNVHKAFIGGNVVFSVGVEFVSTRYASPKGRYYAKAV